MFTTVYAKGAAWNETHWANPKFNHLLDAARGETDDKKRAVMYAEMQQLVHDDGGVIVIVHPANVDSGYADALKTTGAPGSYARPQR